MNVPLNIDWQQILLHLMNFAILAGGLYLLLYKPVKQFMAKREAYYQGLADQAADKLREAEALKGDCQAKLDASAQDDAPGVIDGHSVMCFGRCQNCIEKNKKQGIDKPA